MASRKLVVVVMLLVVLVAVGAYAYTMSTQPGHWSKKFKLIKSDGGSPAKDSNISCGKHTTQESIAKACLANATCVGFSVKTNGKPWCMKKMAGTSKYPDHVYYKKL